VPQLVRPLQNLRTAGDGNHVLTISVTPETLGPVTVRAHVSGDHVRIELVAPTDHARDALRSILTDLRRDLAQGASSQLQSFSLDLSSGGGSGADRGTAAERGERSRPEFTGSAAPAASDRAERPRGADSLLDVLA
jgi:flagellar hook-length control protein FliK